MIPSVTSGIKALYTDTNGTLSYNPYSDTLSANFFSANNSNSTGSISNNNYLGLTSTAIINFGTLTNYYNMKCTGHWPTAVLSAITPSLTINSGSINGDSILKLQTISNGSGYIGMNGLNIGMSIEVDALSPMITIGNNNLTSLWLGNGNGTTTLFGNTNLPVNSSFNHFSKTKYTIFAHTNILQLSIVCRQSTSRMKIIVNIPLANYGTALSNNAASIARSTTAFAAGQTVTTDIVPPNTGILTGSQYGCLNYVFSSLYPKTFGNINFTFLDDCIAFVKGTTYFYAVVMRQNTLVSVASNIGNTSYVYIVVEELF